jgi:hypothetical protein
LPDPAGDLAALIADIDDMPDGLSVYAAPSEKVNAPAIVIRPDTPWISPDKMCHDLERYAAIVVVTANTPEDGIALLRSMLLKIIDALVSPWNWVQAESPVIDETTGVPFLAARLRLTYSNGGPE